jgi:4-hydroxy-3-polyprenylbenzoate decarboxylase
MIFVNRITPPRDKNDCLITPEMLKNKIDYHFLPGDSMAYRDMREFLDKLDELGELRRVRVEVDPSLEIAEITDRVSKLQSGGKALLFESVKENAHPVVTNMFGSFRRICIALEIEELHDLTMRMEELVKQLHTPSSPAKFSEIPSLPGFSRFAPEYVDKGVCQEVVELNPDLALYPILKNWAGDGLPDHNGRFITLPLVVTGDPDSGELNYGMYRVEVFDKDTAGIHWRSGSGGAGHCKKYREKGERMPIAVALGGDPAVIYSASVPLPENMDEMQLAGFLRQEPVQMVGCLTSGLKVPANSELVIEGYLKPGEEGRGGAFGNHTGYYAAPQDVPVMHVTCVTRRCNMIYPATVVGRPPMEDCYLAKATERLLLPMIRLDLPEITDINMPMEGIFHGCAIVAMEKAHPDQPRRAIESIWSAGWLGNARMVVVVDTGVDVRDISLVAWKLFNLVDWQRDIVTDVKVSMGRIGMDATLKCEESQGKREFPKETARSRSIMELVDKKWREYGL